MVDKGVADKNHHECIQQEGIINNLFMIYMNVIGALVNPKQSPQTHGYLVLKAILGISLLSIGDTLSLQNPNDQNRKMIVIGSDSRK